MSIIVGEVGQRRQTRRQTDLQSNGHREKAVVGCTYQYLKGFSAAANIVLLLHFRLCQWACNSMPINGKGFGL